MEIKKNERITSLSDIIKQSNISHSDGELERLRNIVKSSIEFTEKVVERLYAKGIFDDDDIKEIVGLNYDYKYENIEVVKDTE